MAQVFKRAFQDDTFFPGSIYILIAMFFKIKLKSSDIMGEKPISSPCAAGDITIDIHWWKISVCDKEQREKTTTQEQLPRKIKFVLFVCSFPFLWGEQHTDIFLPG